MDLLETIKVCQKQVNNQLTQYIDALPAPATKLKEAMRHGLLLGGKRIRPFLVYEVAKALGADLNLAKAPACAIECIHSYSLIHDDLPAMDDDELRRGNPTVHVAFDEATAILAGDALQAFAFDIISSANFPENMRTNQVKMIAELAKQSGCNGMCGGQELDLLAENQKISQAELENIHRHKTGALIVAAINLGLLCAPTVREDIKDAFISYGKAIGLAFQVWDDVLDIISDTETLGKPQGSDLELHKSTYPNLMGLESAQRYAKELAQKAVAALSDLPIDTQVLQRFALYIVERNH